MNIKKVLCFMLSALMMVSAATPVVAQATEINKAGNGSSTVVLDMEATTFDVTVPTSLPIYVSADGEVTTADDAKIVNNGHAPIMIQGIEITEKNGWTMAESSGLANEPVGSKTFYMEVSAPTLGTTINGNKDLLIAYSGDIAPQSDALNEDIADVTFTIGWQLASIPVNEYYGVLDIGDAGYRLTLNPDFKTALNSTEPTTYEVWSTGDPLPAFPESYNGRIISDLSGMFNGCYETTSLDLSLWDTSNITNMSSMFAGCSKLTSVNVSSFDTSNVTDMSNMFGVYGTESVYSQTETTVTYPSYGTWNGSALPELSAGHDYSVASTTLGLKSLTMLDISNFDTTNVTDMSNMFYGAKVLTDITFGDHFNTANVNDMSYMFADCEAVEAIDIADFNTSSVTDMHGMFNNCISVTNLDLSNFHTGKVTDMSGMFTGCKSLTNLKPTTDVSAVTDMHDMFAGCSSLTTLDLGLFNTESVINMSGMFNDCTALTSLTFEDLDTSSVESMAYMFEDCSKLNSLDLSGFDTCFVTDMSFMFMDCTALANIDISDLDTSAVTNMENMFAGAKIAELDFNGWDTSKVVSMKGMFGNSMIPAGTSFDSFDTSSVETMYGMFYKCTADDLILNFDASNATNMYGMFMDSDINSIALNNWNANKIESMEGFFQKAKITSLEISNFGGNSLTSMHNTFAYIDDLSSFNVVGINTSQVTDMYGFFTGVDSISVLDLSAFDFSSVDNLGWYMFDCDNDFTAVYVKDSNTIDLLPEHCTHGNYVVGDLWDIPYQVKPAA